MSIEITLKLNDEQENRIVDKMYEKAKADGLFKVDSASEIITEDSFISLRQAEKKLNMHKATITRHIKNQIFEGTKVGGRWRISINSINKYINKQKQ